MAAKRLVVASWNVNSLLKRLPGVVQWLEQRQPDVLCLQETKVPDAKFPLEELKAAGYGHVLLNGQKSYNGVAIVSRAPIELLEHSFGPAASTQHDRTLHQPEGGSAAREGEHPSQRSADNVLETNTIYINASSEESTPVKKGGGTKKRSTQKSKTPTTTAYEEARVVCAKVGGEHGVSVVNVYAPNGQKVGSARYFEKLEWFQELSRWMKGTFRPEEKVLLLGDINVVPEDKDIFMAELYNDDRHISCTSKERRALQELTEANALHDTFRMHEQGCGHFSFWGFKGMAWRNDAGWRLDQIYASRTLSSVCSSAWIDRDVRGWDTPSDHVPIGAEFELMSPQGS